MGTLVFCMMPGAYGHHAPTFRIADELQRRGHRVAYLAVDDLAPRIRARGFEHVSLMPEVFPRGWLDALAKGTREERRLRHVANCRAQQDRFLPEITATLERLRPSLVAVDAIWRATATLPTALVAHKLSIPYVLVDTSFPDTRDGGIPSRLSSGLPPKGLGARIHFELDWLRHHAKRLRDVRRDNVPSPKWFDSMAAACGMPRDAVRRRFLTREIANAPHLVLCPRALDFPGSRASNVHYVEASIDAPRRSDDDDAFPWDRLDASRRLFLCSLGTVATFYRRRAELFAAVVGAMRSRPRDQLVLSTGDFDVSELGPLPENVIAVPRSPQVRLLERASLMITHGGLGSIKECILAGVPMVVLPQKFDQPGNAARVRYHRIGVDVELGEDGFAERVEAAIGRVASDADIRANVEAMSAVFRREEERRPSLGFFEPALRCGPRGRSTSNNPGEWKACGS